MSEKQDDETYSTIFAALKHPIRRRILRMLSEEELSYTQMLTKLDVDTGHLNYYLDSLVELVVKNEHGKYRLSEFGKAATELMSKVEDRRNDKKEIIRLRISKRRTVLALQAFAAIILLISSLTFFNIKNESSYSLSGTENPQGGIILQPNSTSIRNDVVMVNDIRANSLTVKYRYYYRIDVLTNATLRIQVLVGATSDLGAPLQQVPAGASVLLTRPVLDQ